MCQEPPESGLSGLFWARAQSHGKNMSNGVEELLVDSGRKVRGIRRMWRISFAWPGYVSCAVWQTALQLGYQKCETMKREKWDGLLVCASNLVSGCKLFIIHILYTYIYIIVYIYSIYYRMYSISNCFFPNHLRFVGRFVPPFRNKDWFFVPGVAPIPLQGRSSSDQKLLPAAEGGRAGTQGA